MRQRIASLAEISDYPARRRFSGLDDVMSAGMSSPIIHQLRVGIFALWLASQRRKLLSGIAQCAVLSSGEDAKHRNIVAYPVPALTAEAPSANSILDLLFRKHIMRRTKANFILRLCLDVVDMGTQLTYARLLSGTIIGVRYAGK